MAPQITAQGNTPEEAEENVKKAIQDALKKYGRETVFKDHEMVVYEDGKIILKHPATYEKFRYIEGGAPLPLPAAPFLTKGQSIYLPVIDTLKTLGVPDENLDWDGQTLKMYMYPDYWFEIDAGDNLLKLNGYTMEYCDQIKTELTGDLMKAGDLYTINGAVMLGSYGLNYFRAMLSGSYRGSNRMGHLRDEKTGIVFFEKVDK